MIHAGMARTASEERGAVYTSPDGPVVDLDSMDRRILSILSEDARLSMREIARRVHLSPGSVAERIARLEERGVILGYHARIAPATLGYRLEAIVGLQTTQSVPLEDILRELLEVPEVEGAYVVSGSWDVVVRIRVRDHQHLRDVIVRAFWKMNAFRHSETMVVFDTHERPGGWNVALALREADDQSAPAPPQR
jgi:Lrp/AsnC family transcriptional regulator, leucine-responsive regulatory protein